MTTSCNYRDPSPAHQILVCLHKGRIIGHILERDGRHHARSWPSEVLIGIYASPAEAVAAIGYAAELYALKNEADRKVTVQTYHGPADADELFDQMWEVIDHHRMREFYTLYRFLDDRGFHHDDFVSLVERAERRYADSPYWTANEEAALS